MLNSVRKNNYVLTVLAVVLSTIFVVFSGCSREPAWKAVNDEVIKKYNLTIRTRDDIPETGIVPNLEPGKVTNIKTLPEIQFAPGVTGRMYWGKGALVNFMTMTAGSEIPRETLSSERIMVMIKGSVEQLINGKFVGMQCTELAPAYYFSTGYLGTKDCLFLEKGAENAVKAGPNGAEFVEFYYPIRLDYIEKTGVALPKNVNFGNFSAQPNFPPNTVFNYYEIQYSELVPEANSRLLNGRGVQPSMLFMDPDSKFDRHTHPEEQVMIVLNGSINEIILDGEQIMKEGDLLYLPANMVHGGVNGPQGCNVIDVFWPVRADYQASMEKRRAAYHAIIPSGEKPKLVAEGFKFTEGPVWMNGTLYFSSMFFDIPSGTWKSDPKKSDLIAMKADGSYKYVWEGRTQTNGLMAKGNGNLVVCDMSGHRVLEVSPSGKIVRVLASKMNDGTRLDGPNDIVIDAKGGIYFTDPQFIFDELKQPGKTVNYIKPNGEVIRIIEPGEFGMANGILLSPDGKTAYVNNTYHDANRMSDVENWVIAYTVNEDGTLSNKRKFAKLFLPVSEYDLGTRSSCADGMTIDELGNLYVATNIGLQIFNPKGEYIGNIFTPTFPVSACFGGDDYKTIYMTCWDKIYSIRTNIRGLEYPLKK